MRVRLLAASVAAAGVLSALAVPRAARADEASDKAMAEALFRAAKELVAESKFAEACPKFAESHRLDPKPGTILNLATCHESEGRIATAWADYGEALAYATRAHQPERERFARGKVAELEKKLSYVKVALPPEHEGMEIVLDGKTLTDAAAGTRVPVDPGEHTIEARAPQKAPWTTKIVVDASAPSERSVEVPALADEKHAPGDGAAPPARGGAMWADHEQSDGGTQRTIGWIVTGVGVVGVGVGAFFGVKTLSEKSTVDANCQGAFCNDEGLAANDRAHSAATISTISIIAGGVCVAGGLALVFTAPHGARSPAPTAAVGPRGVRVGMVW